MVEEKPEFKIGQQVTYMPYESATKMYVVAIQFGAPIRVNKHDNRIFYHLSSTPTGNVTSITTGTSITESKHYFCLAWQGYVDNQKEIGSLSQLEAEAWLQRAISRGDDAYIVKATSHLLTAM